MEAFKFLLKPALRAFIDTMNTPGYRSIWENILTKIDMNDNELRAVLDELALFLFDFHVAHRLFHFFKPIFLDLCARAVEIANKGDGNEDIEKKRKLLYSLASLLEKAPHISSLVLDLLSTNSPLQGRADDLQTVQTAYYLLTNCYNELVQLQLDWSFVYDIYGTSQCPNVQHFALECVSLLDGLSEHMKRRMWPLVGSFDDNEERFLRLKEHHDFERSLEVNTITPCSAENPSTDWPIGSGHLHSSIANICGILVLKNGVVKNENYPLLITPTVCKHLQLVVTATAAGLPVLLNGPGGSGKSSLVHWLANKSGKRLLTVHLGSQTDGKVLLGSYVCTSKPGEFRWQPGVLTRAVQQGCWVLLEDIDRAPNEVLSILMSLLERQVLFLPSRAMDVKPAPGFQLFATRQCESHVMIEKMISGKSWCVVPIELYCKQEIIDILKFRLPKMSHIIADLYNIFDELLRAHAHHRQFSTHTLEKRNIYSLRAISLTDLFKWCGRLYRLHSDVLCHTTVEKQSSLSMSVLYLLFLEGMDVFCSSLPRMSQLHQVLCQTLAESLHLDISLWSDYPNAYTPKLSLEESRVFVGRAQLPKLMKTALLLNSLPFSFNSHTLRVMESVAVGIQMNEPILLVGETGTGKTTAIQVLAKQLGHRLTVINMSQQSDTADLLGGFKPVDIAHICRVLKDDFENLFTRTFSKRTNVTFLDNVRRSFQHKRWSRLVLLFESAFRLAEEKLTQKQTLVRKQEDGEGHEEDSRQAPKRLASEDGVIYKEASTAPSFYEELQTHWQAFHSRVQTFKVQQAHCEQQLLFDFVEGALTQAVRRGDWILLDEINLASTETLECLTSLVQRENSGLLLPDRQTESTGSDAFFVARHPSFRLFACMNPSTDIGKSDLPSGLRHAFHEVFVDDITDARDISSIVELYLGDVGTSRVETIVQFYLKAKDASARHVLFDGTHQRVHYSLRTLTRALEFAVTMKTTYGWARAFFEGCSMTFLSQVHHDCQPLLMTWMKECIGIEQARHIDSNTPFNVAVSSTSTVSRANCVFIDGYSVQIGALPVEEEALLHTQYILTPSVQTNLRHLVRGLATRKYPILIQGPTSSGKTSMIEYLARRTGHQFVRINNHEHTDIQEYIGMYTSRPSDGQLEFREGILVEALRKGYWIVLDELNLAPSDVLEALNRLLDDNRELFVPETQETIRPHPDFMLFATQNPPGLYGGRKVLSRAFRNRFIELQYDELPSDELKVIIERRCKMAPSHAGRMVEVFKELQTRRQTSRLFAGKHGFMTLRDLFRWAERGGSTHEELAMDGYMLMAERARRPQEKQIIKDVLETTFKVSLIEDRWYTAKPEDAKTDVVWTKHMRRLYALVRRCLECKEPILLVGEAGSGKTTICQVLAALADIPLHMVNCHQNTETADLLGNQRPVRDREFRAALARDEMMSVLVELNVTIPGDNLQMLKQSAINLLRELPSDDPRSGRLLQALEKVNDALRLFLWVDGPLVEAMKSGSYFLLDEISLAEDSVLERLNSVLEPGRRLVLAEKGSDPCIEDIVASASFRFMATMNPGGDFGKKELSPALRNRFTEIWVPTCDAESDDVMAIICHRWKQEALLVSYAHRIVEFQKWFNQEGHSRVKRKLSLRDVLAWSDFMLETWKRLSLPESFVHGCCLAILDGLGCTMRASEKTDKHLMEKCVYQLSEHLIDNSIPHSCIALWVQSTPSMLLESDRVVVGPFSLPRQSRLVVESTFSFHAATTARNALRLVRALELPRKPILLEGSPGVGKTSVVMALAHLLGRDIVRINLSQHTDLMDLFGSDMPWSDESSTGGLMNDFAWHDGPFLDGMKKGKWILLDEMNLASQSVLEGLNACLDHRGTVFIAELNRSFQCSEQFRVFACQNPLSQGGGRKGLPQSFLDRFTRVFVDAFDGDDIHVILSHQFPLLNEVKCMEGTPLLPLMIQFNQLVYERTVTEKVFGRLGRPWEFNVRDLARCCELLSTKMQVYPLSVSLPLSIRHIYSQRFRHADDRECIKELYHRVFPSTVPWTSRINLVDYHLTDKTLRVGHGDIVRSSSVPISHCLQQSGFVLSSQPILGALETLIECIHHRWLPILVGPTSSGKSSLINWLAACVGRPLHTLNVNSTMDTLELLGGYEQSDVNRSVNKVVDQCLRLCQRMAVDLRDTPMDVSGAFRRHWMQLKRRTEPMIHMKALSDLFQTVGSVDNAELQQFKTALQHLETTCLTPSTGSQFVWVDSLLIEALENGYWLVLDNVNFCTSSVLDRLNSLVEPAGTLTLSERGMSSDGTVPVIRPHPDFRLFMTMDASYGDLSRAMRNRGIEIALIDDGHATALAERVLAASLNVDSAVVPSLMSLLDNPSCARVRHTAQMLTTLQQRGWSLWESVSLVLGKMINATALTARVLLPKFCHEVMLRDASLFTALSHYWFLTNGNVTCNETSLVRAVMRDGVPEERSCILPLLTVLPRKSENLVRTWKSINDQWPLSLYHMTNSSYTRICFGEMLLQLMLQGEVVCNAPKDALWTQDAAFERFSRDTQMAAANLYQDYVTLIRAMCSGLACDDHSLHHYMEMTNTVYERLSRYHITLKHMIVERWDIEDASCLFQSIQNRWRQVDATASPAAIRKEWEMYHERLTGLVKSLHLYEQPLSFQLWKRGWRPALMTREKQSELVTRLKRMVQWPLPLTMSLNEQCESLSGADNTAGREQPLVDSALSQWHRQEVFLTSIMRRTLMEAVSTLELLPCDEVRLSSIGDIVHHLESVGPTSHANEEMKTIGATVSMENAIKVLPLKLHADRLEELQLLSHFLALHVQQPHSSTHFSVDPEIDAFMTMTSFPILDYACLQKLKWMAGAEDRTISKETTVSCLFEVQFYWQRHCALLEGIPTSSHPGRLALTALTDVDKMPLSQCGPQLALIKDFRTLLARSTMHLTDDRAWGMEFSMFESALFLCLRCCAFDGPELSVFDMYSDMPARKRLSSLSRFLSEGLLSQENVRFQNHVRAFLGDLPHSDDAPDKYMGICWLALSHWVLSMQMGANEMDGLRDPGRVFHAKWYHYDQEQRQCWNDIQAEEAYLAFKLGAFGQLEEHRTKLEGLRVATERVKEQCPLRPSDRNQQRWMLSQLHRTMFDVRDRCVRRSLDVLKGMRYPGQGASDSEQEQKIAAEWDNHLSNLDSVIHQLRRNSDRLEDLLNPIELSVLFARKGLYWSSRYIKSQPLSTMKCSATSFLASFPCPLSQMRSNVLSILPRSSTFVEHETLLPIALLLHKTATMGGSKLERLQGLLPILVKVHRMWTLNNEAGKLAEQEGAKLFYYRARSDTLTDHILSLEDLFPKASGDDNHQVKGETFAQDDSANDDRHSKRNTTVSDSLEINLVAQDWPELIFNALNDVLELSERHEQQGTVYEALSRFALVDADQFLPVWLLVRAFHVSTKETYTTPQIYNYYQDPHPVILLQLLPMLTNFRQRITKLQVDYSDHEVLVNLDVLLERLMQFSVHTPLAKMGVGLEKLLCKAIEWENYAASHVSIKPHIELVTQAIIQCRKIEIGSWPNLFTHQHRQYASQSLSMWFQLFRIFVMVPFGWKNDNTLSGTNEYIKEWHSEILLFLQSSSLGDFETRISLIAQFAEITEMLTKKYALQYQGISCYLRNLYAYFKFFVTNIQQHLKDSSESLRKDLAGFSKLSGWQDTNYFSVKDNSAKTRNRIAKFLRDYEELLSTPWTVILRASSSEQFYERIKDHNHSEVLWVLPISALKLCSTWPEQSRFSAKLSLLAAKLSRCSASIVDGLVKNIMGTTTNPLEQWSKKIIAQCEEFQKQIDVPLVAESANAKRHLKNSKQVRKRMWVDLLRMLQTMGFRGTLQSLNCHRTEDLLIKTRPLSTSNVSLKAAVDRCNVYVVKFWHKLDAIRAQFHEASSKDVTHHEMELCKMFVDGLVGWISGQQQLLAAHLDNIDVLVSASGVLHMYEEEMRPSMTNVLSGKTLAAVQHCRNACQDVCDVVDQFHLLSEASSQCLPVDITDQFQCFRKGTSMLTAFTSQLTEAKRAGIQCFVITSRQHAQFCELQAAVDQALTTLHSHSLQTKHHLLNRLLILVVSQLEKLREALSTLLGWPRSDSKRASLAASYDVIIVHCLLSAQRVLRSVSQKQMQSLDMVDEKRGEMSEEKHVDQTDIDEMGELREREFRKSADDHYRVLWDHLNVPKFVDRVRHFSQSASTEMDIYFPSLTYWKDHFMTLSVQLGMCHLSYLKSSVKFANVLLTLFSSVLKNGFCVPDDVEDAEDTKQEASGERGEFIPGTGIGAGQGQRDVSHEIEDEEQILGTRKDAEDKNDPASMGDVAEEEHGIDMAQDFDGEMFDMEKPSDQDNEDSSASEKESMEDKMDSDLEGDMEAMDERLWNEDDEERPSSDTEDQSSEKKKPTPALSEQKVSASTDAAALEMGANTNAPKEDPDQPKEMSGDNDKGDPSGKPSEETSEEDGGDVADAVNELSIADDDLVPMQMEEKVPTKDEEERLEEQQQELLEDENALKQAELSASETSLDETDDRESGAVPDTLEESMTKESPVLEDIASAAETETPNDKERESDIKGEEEEEEKKKHDSHDIQPQADHHVHNSGEFDQSSSNTTQYDRGHDAGSFDEKRESQGLDADRGQSSRQHRESPSDRGRVKERDQYQDGKTNRDSTMSNETDAMSANGEESLEQSEKAESGTMKGSNDATENQPLEIKNETANPLNDLGSTLDAWHKRLNVLPKQTDEEKPVDNSAVNDGDKESMVDPHNQDFRMAEKDEDFDSQLLAGATREQAVAQVGLDVATKERTEAVYTMDVAKDRAEEQTLLEILAQTAITEKGDASLVNDQLPSQALMDWNRDKESVESLRHQMETRLRELKVAIAGDNEGSFEQLWQDYEGMTLDLAFELCEQLRLIIEPTLATKLQGDYKSGKRINMRKIIPYVASQFRKDKIWLRRTKKSKRQYKVLVALDDSQSMGDSHSIQLSFESLAMLLKSFTLLEIGEMGVVSFGEQVTLLQPFCSAFNAQQGADLLRQLSFSQNCTNMRNLISSVMEIFNTSSSVSEDEELWRLVVIISDGVCEDHSAIAQLLRLSQERRIQFLFVIVDNKKVGSSITDLKSVTYPNGRLTITRYMDTFPFEFHVVLRNNVNALPDILSEMLRQWFEYSTR